MSGEAATSVAHLERLAWSRLQEDAVLPHPAAAKLRSGEARRAASSSPPSGSRFRAQQQQASQRSPRPALTSSRRSSGDLLEAHAVAAAAEALQASPTRRWSAEEERTRDFDSSSQPAGTNPPRRLTHPQLVEDMRRRVARHRHPTPR